MDGLIFLAQIIHSFCFRGNIKLGPAIVGIFIMVIFSMLSTYPVFHFAGIDELLSPEPQGSSASIYVCHEIWPSWIRLSYQVGFTFGHILLPSIFIVSIHVT